MRGLIITKNCVQFSDEIHAMYLEFWKVQLQLGVF